MERLYKQGKVQMENSSSIICAFLFFPKLHKILYFCMSAVISLGKNSQYLLAISQNLDIKNHRFTKRYTSFPIIISKILTFQVLCETHPEAHETWYHMVQLLMPIEQRLPPQNPL